MTMIIKCDNCKKIISWQELQDLEYNYSWRMSSHDIREQTHLCRKCKINLSEKFHEKYEKLKEIHSNTLKELKGVRKTCADYKKLSKEELQKTAKVVFS